MFTPSSTFSNVGVGVVLGVGSHVFGTKRMLAQCMVDHS